MGEYTDVGTSVLHEAYNDTELCSQCSLAPLPPLAPSMQPAVPGRARILVICRLRRCALPYSWNTMPLPAAAAGAAAVVR